jgi:LPS export ABC transporter protein LptC
VNKALRIAVGIGLLLVLTAGVWWFLDRETLLPSLVDQVEVDLSLQGVRLSQGKEGRTAWTLQADKARFDEDSGLLHLGRPRVTYRSETEGDPVFVQAPEGEVSQERNTARMWSGVQARYQGHTVTADRLDYVGRQDRITFTGQVVMSGRGTTIHAPRATIDLKDNVMTARGGVEAVLEDSGEIGFPGETATEQEKGKEK